MVAQLWLKHDSFSAFVLYVPDSIKTELFVVYCDSAQQFQGSRLLNVTFADSLCCVQWGGSFVSVWQTRREICDCETWNRVRKQNLDVKAGKSLYQTLWGEEYLYVALRCAAALHNSYCIKNIKNNSVNSAYS